MIQHRHITTNLINASRGIRRTLGSPRVIGCSIVVAGLFALVIFFLTNSNFYGPLLFSSLPLTDKIGVIGTMISQLLHQSVSSPVGALLIIVSLLQGVSISLLYVTARYNRHDQRAVGRQLTLGGIASLAATLGLGCVPCGTSLIVPIVAVFFSGTAAASATTVAHAAMLILALFLSLVSLYKSGQIAFVYTELIHQEESHAAPTTGR